MRWSDLFHWTPEERRALLAIVLFTGGGGLLIELGRRYPAWTPDLKLLESTVPADSLAVPVAGAPGGSPSGSASAPGADSTRAALRAGVWGSGESRAPGEGPTGAGSGGAGSEAHTSSEGRTRRAARDERPAGPIDLNRADAATLTLLPGVGPKLAERIVADRAALGPYRSLADLDRVKGVGPALLQKLAGVVVVGVSSDSM